jgi:hypothetical protein
VPPPRIRVSTSLGHQLTPGAQSSKESLGPKFGPKLPNTGWITPHQLDRESKQTCEILDSVAHRSTHANYGERLSSAVHSTTLPPLREA